ncbi:MAG TPA: 4-hydroxy-tetrahydrodipicolinate synthase [Bacillota bacterium]|nr:4-hydroxy-tetrahydrodipicolinate synthase [Bacillota bacterium]
MFYLLQGIFSPAITVFNDKGKLDYDGNERVIGRLIDNGINGILSLGSIGEFCHLTMAEKKEFISFVVQTVKGRVPVLIGTGGTMLEEVLELTRYAHQAGADYSMVISPYYFKLDEESLFHYYAAVAAAADLPMLIYNFPDRTCVDLSPELVLRLAKAFPNIVGIKDTVDNISHTRKLIRTVKSAIPDFAVFSGYDEYLIPNLMAGGAGVICGLTNLAPQLFTELLGAFRQNDLKTVGQLQGRINGLMELYEVSQPFVNAIKGAAACLIPDISYQSRMPVSGLSQEQMTRIKQILTAAGINIV